MYKVIKAFTDIQDGGYFYNIGDAFPRDGVEVSKDRVAVLASKANRQHTPLIEDVPDIPEVEIEPKPKKPGRPGRRSKKK